MPKFAILFESLIAQFFTWMAIKFGISIAVKMSVIMGLAAMYVSVLVAFNNFVTPLLSQLFATNFGFIIGLAFPPISQTVITGLIALWVGSLIYNYFHAFGMALIK